MTEHQATGRRMDTSWDRTGAGKPRDREGDPEPHLGAYWRAASFAWALAGVNRAAADADAEVT